MASSSQIREWWKGYQWNTARYVRVSFPGDGRDWDLYVADQSAPIWEAVSQIMESEPYLFLESAGGTYSEREPGSTSLHTYALALDLNPKKNPMKNPPQHNYPASFIDRMEGIRANGEQAIYWGGRWPASNPPDTMHWQINVSPADCKNITWDKGEDVDGPHGEPNWDEVSDWAQQAWTEAHQAKLLTDDSHPRDSLEVEELMVYLKRAKII
jgi:hypothetical protein